MILKLRVQGWSWMVFTRFIILQLGGCVVIIAPNITLTLAAPAARLRFGIICLVGVKICG